MHKKKTYAKKIILLLTIVVLAAVMLIASSIIYNNWMYIVNGLNKKEAQITQEEKNYLSQNITYTNYRKDYTYDLEFANFRVLKGGQLKDNLIYRGASPYLDNERTFYVNKYLEINDIKHFISLSDNETNINNYLDNEDYGNLYFGKNYKNSAIFDEALNFEGIDLSNPNDIKKIINTFNNISNSAEKIYVHCQIGRDRTGAYCALLEALAGFSYKEIVDDYMLSFQNYSYITYNNTPKLYNNIKWNGVDTFLMKITGLKDPKMLENANLQKSAKNFMLNNGMYEDEIDSLVEHICK